MYSEYEYDEVYSEDGGHEYDEDGSLVSDTCAGKKLFFYKGVNQATKLDLSLCTEY